MVDRDAAKKLDEPNAAWRMIVVYSHLDDIYSRDQFVRMSWKSPMRSYCALSNSLWYHERTRPANRYIDSDIANSLFQSVHFFPRRFARLSFLEHHCICIVGTYRQFPPSYIPFYLVLFTYMVGDIERMSSLLLRTVFVCSRNCNTLRLGGIEKDVILNQTYSHIIRG